MKEPFLNMWEPHKDDFKKRTRNVDLYTHFESMLEEEPSCRYCDDESCQGDCEDALRDEEEFRDKDQPKLPKIPLEKVNIQTLLDLLPNGVTPADVKIRTRLNSGDYPTGYYITFYYSTTLPADLDGYKAAKTKYDEAVAEYKKKKAAYDQWVKEQQIKELEGKLADLKK